MNASHLRRYGASVGVALSPGCLGPNPAWVGRAEGAVSQGLDDGPSSSSRGDGRGEPSSSGGAGTGGGSGTMQGETDDDGSTGGSGAETSEATSGGTPTGDLDIHLWTFGPPVDVTELGGFGYHDDPSVRSDGLEILFASTRDGFERIYRSTRSTAEGVFGVPTRLDALMVGPEQTLPRLTHDGDDVVFSGSDVLGGARHLYVSSRTDWSTGWATPRRFTELEPFSAGQLAGMLMPNRLQLYYVVIASVPGPGDIYLATRGDAGAAFSMGTPLSAVNSTFDDTAPWIDESGRLMVFASNRRGNFDIWWSWNDGNGFGAPQPLDALNTGTDEMDPWISTDLRWLYYCRGATGTVVRSEIFSP